MTVYFVKVDLNYHGTPKYPTGESNYTPPHRVGSSFSEQLSPIVTRVLGQNPGKFTLQGTNTYFIGRSAPFILIDTGEGKPEYITQLREFFKSIGAKSSLISDIILTHKHHDHHGGLIDVLKEVEAYGGAIEKPRIHIHPLPAGTSDSTLNATISRLTETKYTPYNVTSPLYPLSNGTKIRTHDESAELEIVHTPGHTADSISLILYALHSDSPVPEGLFTADTVLGAGTAVFEDLSAYMTSLRHLVSLPIWSSGISIHPGHGPTVPPERSKAHIETYISHREAREKQILATLKGRMSIGQIVESIYADVPKTLWPAAAHGVGLHLRKLEAEGRAKRVGGGSVDLIAGDGTKMEQVGQAGISQVWELVEETKL